MFEARLRPDGISSCSSGSDSVSDRPESSLCDSVGRRSCREQRQLVNLRSGILMQTGILGIGFC